MNFIQTFCDTETFIKVQIAKIADINQSKCQ